MTRFCYQLSSSCADFTASIAPIITSRTRLNLVRNNIASIEDILSIPRLVSTCIRSGWWSEAVDLAFRARELEDILKGQAVQRETATSRRSLLGKVRADVEDELETLRSRIIEGLRGRGLKLPSAVRSIALLRRLSTEAPSNSPKGVKSKGLSEPELRLTFLVSRWDCLRFQLEQLEMSAGSAASSDDRLRSVKRWIEVWREVVGETVTIYTEIFLTPGISPDPSNPNDENAHSAYKEAYSPLALSGPSSPLVVFLAQAQGALTSLLQHQLPQIAAASSLVSVQTQLAYCAAAFSKFGFDFRHIPNRAIASRLLEIAFERFDFAVETFRKELSRCFTLSGARGGKPRLVINAMVSAESWDSILALEESEIASADITKSSHPPAFIALFPPLAKLINGYSAALNELRLLPITSLYPTVVRALRSSLTECAAYMVQFVQTASESQQTYPDEEHDDQTSMQTMILRKSSLILSKRIIPWILWALNEIVYPDIDKTRWQDANSNLNVSLAKLGQLLHLEDAPQSQNPEDPPPSEDEPAIIEDQLPAKSSETALDVVEANAADHAQIGQDSENSIDAEPSASEFTEKINGDGAEDVERVNGPGLSAAEDKNAEKGHNAS